MPRRTAVVEAPPQKVNVSVDMPQSSPAAAPDAPEERSPTWFWDLLQDVPKEKWGNTYDVMGFRIDPKPSIAPGGKGFLFQIMEPITALWVKQNYGGGKFRVILQKNSRFFKSHEFDIEGQPKYDLTRELPNVPATSATGTDGKLLSILEAQISRLNDQLTASQSQGKENPALTEAITILSTAYKESVAQLGSNSNGGTSTHQLSELVNIVKGLIPQQSSDGGILGMVLKPLLEKLLTPPDPMAQVTTFLTIFEKIDSIRGGGGDSKPKDWRAMLAEGVVAKGPELLREVRETFQESTKAATEKRATAEAIERMESARRNGTAPAAQPGAPSTAPAHAAVMPAGPLRTVPLERSAPAEPAATPAAAPGMSAAETDAVGKFMEQRIVEMIRDDRDAEDVVDFIEDVDPTLNDMLATYSADMVTTFLAARPIIGQATQHPKWNDFLFAAQKYIKEIREEDKAIEAAAAAVPS